MRSGYRGQLKSGLPTTREQTNKKSPKLLKLPKKKKRITLRNYKEYMEWDCSIEEMCLHSGISASTYHRWTKENPKLKERINELRKCPDIIGEKKQ